jgi:hypothetical protein
MGKVFDDSSFRILYFDLWVWVELMVRTFLFNDVVQVPWFLVTEGAIRLDEEEVEGLVVGIPVEIDRDDGDLERNGVDVEEA